MDPHPTSDDIELYLKGQLPLGDSSKFHDHLDQCEQCRSNLADVAMDLQWKGPERRAEPRIPVSLPGRLKLLDPLTSVGPPHDVVVVEISRNGLKIQTERYMIPKTLVQVRFGSKIVLGEVRYCTKSERGYRIGLKQVPDFTS